jgi:hypothetical protein
MEKKDEPASGGWPFGTCLAGDPSFFFRRMSEILTADLLALDTDGLKSRLSKLRRYL